MILSIVFKPYFLSTHREVVLILWVLDFQQHLGTVRFLQVQGSEKQLLFPVTNFGYLKNSQKVFLAAAQFLESNGVNTASNCSWVFLSRMPGLLLSLYSFMTHLLRVHPFIFSREIKSGSFLLFYAT